MKQVIKCFLRLLEVGLVYFTVAKTFGMSFLHLVPILVACVYLSMRTVQKPQSRRTQVVAAVISAVFAVFTVLANYRNVFDAYMLSTVLKTLACVFGWCLLYQMCLIYIYALVGKIEIMSKDRIQRNWPVFAVSFAIILLSWLPYFLLFFPGISNDDSNWQIQQALGMTPLSNHHPIAHTMLLQFLLQIGLKINGTLMSAVAFASIIQMTVSALVFSGLVYSLRKNGISAVFWAAAIAYFAFIPYHAMFSITLWKDSWFGVVFLLFLTTLWNILQGDKSKKIGYYVRCAILLVSGAGVCLLRTNGYYVMIAALPFAVWFLFRERLVALIACIGAVAISAVILGPVYRNMDAIPVDTIEYLSIPVQQVARVIADGQEVDKRDLALLSQVVDVERIPSAYYERISDNIKNLVREKGNQEYLNQHKADFLKLWLRLGAKYPLQYLVAFTDGTYGFSYPDVGYWTFLSATEQNTLGLSNISQLNASIVREPLVWWLENAHKIPVISLLYSCGVLSWISIITFGRTIIQKDRKRMLILLPVIFLWLTTMVSTPVFCQMRYIYAISTALPLIVVVLFSKNARGNTE